MYDHGTKAGNQGDVVKHTLLAGLLHRMPASSEEPFFYVESHAGAFEHVLAPDGEWRCGVGAVATSAKAAATVYGRHVLPGLRVDGGRYPGSAALAERVLSARDLRVHTLLHDIRADVGASLSAAGAGAAVTRTVRIADGYRGAREALLQTGEKPSFVFIDPPGYEPDAVTDLLQLARELHVPALAWLPVLAGPDGGVDAVSEWTATWHPLSLVAQWPRPERADICTRGCVCVGTGFGHTVWDAAVGELTALGLPAGWVLSDRRASV